MSPEDRSIAARPMVRLASQALKARLWLQRYRHPYGMDEDSNPLMDLPPEVLELMTTEERLRYLIYISEPPPPSLTEWAKQLIRATTYDQTTP